LSIDPLVYGFTSGASFRGTTRGPQSRCNCRTGAADALSAFRAATCSPALGASEPAAKRTKDTRGNAACVPILRLLNILPLQLANPFLQVTQPTIFTCARPRVPQIIRIQHTIPGEPISWQQQTLRRPLGSPNSSTRSTGLHVHTWSTNTPWYNPNGLSVRALSQMPTESNKFK